WLALALTSCLGEVWVNGKGVLTQMALAVSEMKRTSLVDGNLPLDAAESQEQANLLRCIFGPQPLHSVSINPAWWTWNQGIVINLAKSIYDDRAFDRMPILAEALEKAGCTNQEILTHCRGPGPHVLGCWVVDLLLGKE